MKRLVALALCGFALLLPSRGRVLFSEFLGWLYQLGYWVVFRLARFLVRSLRD